MLPLYGTLPRRLNALVIDSLVVGALIAGVATLGAAFEWSADARKVLFGMVIATLVLYEPVLVWRYGGTVGHRTQNLRVVADSGGTPSFLRALLRWAAKVPLGALALVAIPATPRHQAVHDLIARTTVQIRDPSRAPAHTYALARPAPEGPLPSRSRRVLVIIGYELLLFAAVVTAVYMGSSQGCLDYNQCTAAENAWNILISVVWLGASILMPVLGMSGRLWGARRGSLTRETSSAAT